MAKKKHAMLALAEKVACDKADHGYIELYKQLVRKDLQNLLEIGLHEGASARLWRGWLRNPERIDFIELSPEHIDADTLEDLINDGVRVFFEDVKEVDLRVLAPEYDIIIDDGSHNNRDQIAAFARLWPLVSPGGWYVIEDLHTSAEYKYAQDNGERNWNEPAYPTVMQWLLDMWHVLNEHGQTEYGTGNGRFAQMWARRSIVAFQKPLD